MAEKGSNIWLIIMLTIFIIIGVIIKTYSYNKYLSYYGKLEDNLIKIYVLKEDISRLTNNLIIDKKRKYCITSKISNSYILDENYNKYYEVYYKCDVSNTDNYIFDIKIDLGKTTIIETLKNKIRKGLEL